MGRSFWPLVDVYLSEKARVAVGRVLDSGKVTMGALVREFERRFAELVGSKYVVMVNSGSSANLLAVAAMHYHPERSIRRGDVAIVPAIAWPTTYAPLNQYGLRLCVVDVDLFSMNALCDEIETTLKETPQVKLLVGVSILGAPAHLTRMRELANQTGVWFWEDNCESLGASRSGKQAGTFGDLGTFSLFYSHHLQAVEGGVIVTDNPVLYELLLCLRSHGWARDLPQGSTFVARELMMHAKNDDHSFPSAYTFLIPGYNVRPTEIQAAIGLSNLDTYERDQISRRENMLTFANLIESDPTIQELGYRFQSVQKGGRIPFGFVVVATSPEHRGRVLRSLNCVGIEYRMVTGGCFTEHLAARHYEYYTPNDLPNAKRIHHCGFFVGNHTRNLTSQIEALRDVLIKTQ